MQRLNDCSLEEKITVPKNEHFRLKQIHTHSYTLGFSAQAAAVTNFFHGAYNEPIIFHVQSCHD